MTYKRSHSTGIRGPHAPLGVTDEITGFPEVPPRLTVYPETGYGFIDSRWGRVELDPDDLRALSKRVHAAVDADEDIRPIADIVVRTRGTFDAVARREIDRFAAEMRERTVPGSLWTAFDADDGTITVGIDPAAPTDYVDPIPPLESL